MISRFTSSIAIGLFLLLLIVADHHSKPQPSLPRASSLTAETSVSAIKASKAAPTNLTVFTVGEPKIAPAAKSVPADNTLAAILPGVTAQNWAAWKPSKIVVALEPGLELPFDLTHVVTETVNGQDITTWTGRNALKGASLVGIGKQDSWYGVLMLPGGTYDVYVHNVNGTAVAAVTASSMEPLNCGTTNTTAQAMVNTSGDAKPLDLVVTGNSTIHASVVSHY